LSAVRVAIVTTSWPADEHDPSGHFVRASARQLERSGHSVTVISPRAGGAFGWPGAAARLRERPARTLDAARWVATAHVRLRALEVDRVTAHWAVPCAWPVAAGARAPLDVVSHGADVRLLAAMPRALREWVVARVAKQATSWTFASRTLLDQLLTTLDGATCARVRRVATVEAPPIEMPDAASSICELRRRLGARRVAVSVGRLVASKRVDRAIVLASQSKEIETLVILGDGPERPRLQRLARALGVDARFIGTVGRPEALAWIGAADLLIHASQAEGLSTVVREAEALGTPVVLA
jgi:teichuronic acid biosynthesis glycosyltransferase TuaC